MRHAPCLKSLLLACVLASLGCNAGIAPDPELRQAWSEYYSTLIDVRSRLQGSRHFDTPVAQADAYRYLLGLISLHDRLYIHFGDPLQPVFVRWVGLDADWGFSNPDQLHLVATISGDRSYRIRGNLGSASQTTFASHHPVSEGMAVGSTLGSDDLEVGSDGEFELMLNSARAEGNWLRLDPDSTRVTIYQTFADWDREERGRFLIERIGGEGRPSDPSAPSVMARRITLAARSLRRYVHAWLTATDGLTFLPVNTLAKPERMTESAEPARWIVTGHYALAEDEALVIEARAPHPDVYWGFALYDAWSQALPYASHQTSLNHRQARIDADGGLRLVLAASDPGVPNWLDTSAHPRGIMTWRVRAGDAPEPPTTRVVPLALVHDAFPPDTPSVSPEERREAMVRRQRHLAQRYAN